MCVNSTPLGNIRLVVFDVDGTLYDQTKLRNKMLLSLFSYYILRPWAYKDLLVIHHFRKQRELMAGYESLDLGEQQFEWCATKLNLSTDIVKAVINKWIFNFPLKYLKSCLYPGVKETFDFLTESGIKIAIYSDYEAVDKLKNMSLQAELIVSSTDSNINAMKPKPNGINFILDYFKITDKSKVLFIGDRDELDGACARLADIPYLIINKQEARNNFYNTLLKNMLNYG